MSGARAGARIFFMSPVCAHFSRLQFGNPIHTVLPVTHSKCSPDSKSGRRLSSRVRGAARRGPQVDGESSLGNKLTKLSHYDEKGRVRMVDVTTKAHTQRTAAAEAFVRMKSATVASLRRLKS